MISRTDTVTNSSDENGRSTTEGTNTNTNTDKGTKTNKGTTVNTGNSSGTTAEQGTSETTETWTENVMGKNNSENYGQLLIEFRKSIINIDKMIIDELNSLFIQLW